MKTDSTPSAVTVAMECQRKTWLSRRMSTQRRHHLLGSAANHEQVLITTTDLDRFEPDFLAQASLFRVTQGRIEPLSA